MPDTAIPLPPLLTDEDREQLLQAAAELGAQVQQIVTAVMPVFQAVVEQAARTFAALQSAGLLDADGKPTRPADRPAWQSPYGPPTTRH